MALSQGEATDIARRIVLALAGGRWVSPPVQMVDEYPLPASGQIILSGRPVVSVESVVLTSPSLVGSLVNSGGAPPVAGQFRVVNGFVLDIGRPAGGFGSVYNRMCAAAPANASVTYTYGLNTLPALLQRAVDVFATEVLAAEAGANTCRIPERVSQVTRQGMSWTLIDPLDFLDKGKTGIYEVDLAIRALNPSGAKRRARVFTSSMSAPAIRRTP